MEKMKQKTFTVYKGENIVLIQLGNPSKLEPGLDFIDGLVNKGYRTMGFNISMGVYHVLLENTDSAA